MINVNPYLSKLNLLREYMEMRIDRKGKIFTVDMDSIPVGAFTPEQLIYLFYQTGMISASTTEYQPTTVTEISFDEWLQTKN